MHTSFRLRHGSESVTVMTLREGSFLLQESANDTVLANSNPVNSNAGSKHGYIKHVKSES